MSETKRATNKKNSNRLKVKDRPFYTSIQRNYHTPKPKAPELTIKLF